MDSPFIEQAIPMVAVDEHSGSNSFNTQNTYSPTKLPSSSEPYKDPSQSSQSQDSTEPASPIFSTESYSTGAMASELDPRSILAPKVSGAGAPRSRALPQMESQLISWSSTQKE